MVGGCSFDVGHKSLADPSDNDEKLKTTFIFVETVDAGMALL